MKKSILYTNDDNKNVVCALCAHRCKIANGNFGLCRTRLNDNGTLYTQNYGRAIAVNIDPIEKKPLYHFLPSSLTYSIAAAGCNFKCGFCQNWEISQLRENTSAANLGTVLSPQKIISDAQKYSCPSVSFTYTEPTVFFEYALDTAKLAKEAGIKTVFVSNGYMTEECLQLIAPYLDAANIDLKSFRDDFYKKHCGASLSPVLESLKRLKNAGVHLEVTTLVITGENDSEEELADIADFIFRELGKDTPWHVSRFFPRYRMTNRAATDIAAIKRAVEIGRAAGLQYVYAGNI